jgi:hypothetical protein
MRPVKSIFAAAFAVALVALSAGTAAAQEATAPYRPASKDPFTGYKVYFRKKPVKKVAPKPEPVTPPSIDVRIEQYKAQKRAAMSLQQPAPKPTTALLLGEVQVTGIFRTPRGYAAMVEAKPINLSYVIYPGEPFFDGMLVAIEETRLVFRHETRWTDGRRDVKVETKPLRQPTAADALTAQKKAEAPKDAVATAATAAAAAPAKKEEKSPASGSN